MRIQSLHMRKIFIAVGVILLVFIVFGASLSQDFAPIDDVFLIYNNLAVRGISLANLKMIFTTYDPELYIPLTLFTYQLNYLVGELNPFVFHLTNLILHAANALLVMWLVSLLTQRRWVAIACGFLFAVHPIHTEAVVWLAGRKDLLSTFFFLLSFILYIRYRQHIRHSYLLSILLFLFALLAKAVVVTLPAVLILYGVLIEKRSINRKLILDTLPYIVLSILFMIIALGGKERIVASSAPFEMLLMAGKSAVFYLQKFILPTDLSVIYPYYKPITFISPDFFAPLLVIISLIIITVWSLRKTQWAAFGLLFYFITLSPTFPNFQKGSLITFAVDRYAYIPSIGIFILVAMSLSFLFEHKSSREAVIGIFIVIILVFGFLSYKQTQLWDSPQKLFSHVLAIYPQSHFTRIDLARRLQKSGKYEEAFALLKEGLRYGDTPYLRMAAGGVYAELGQVEDAREQFETAISLDPQNPEPYFSLGSLEEQLGNADIALTYYEQAVALDSSYVIARAFLGEFYLDQERLDEAREQFIIALDWNPSSFEAHAGMARLLLLQEKPDEAWPHLQKAQALRSYDPDLLVLFARYWITQNNTNDAREYLNQALRIDRNHEEARTLMNELK